MENVKISDKQKMSNVIIIRLSCITSCVVVVAAFVFGFARKFSQGFAIGKFLMLFVTVDDEFVLLWIPINCFWFFH